MSPTIVTGSAAATAGVGDTVEVFANVSGSCKDMSIYKGSTVGDAAGNWTLTGITINPSESVLATARTLANRNTSQASPCTVPLPVEVSSFSASCIENKVFLQWVTASELNSKLFTLERSADGQNYKLIGTHAAAGKSTTRIDYYLKDEAPLAGTVYYRLTQTDLDGTKQEFSIVYTNDCHREAQASSLYPNPSQNAVNLDLPEYIGKNVKIEFISSLGKIEMQREFFVNSSVQQIQLEELSNGIYSVRIIAEKKQEILRLLKN